MMLSACAAPTLRSADIQDQIARGLAEQVGGRFTVTCPTAVPADPGFAFTCSVTDESAGRTVTVSVEVQDDAGAFTWQVTSTGGG
jgi:hypothetical protein